MSPSTIIWDHASDFANWTAHRIDDASASRGKQLFFREKEIERHERLTTIMAKLDADERQLLMKAPHEEEEKEEAVASAAKADTDEETIQYPFYTQVTSALRNAKVDIAKWAVVVTHSFHIDIFSYENSVTDFTLAKYSLVLRAAKRITCAQRKREINAKLD